MTEEVKKEQEEVKTEETSTEEVVEEKVEAPKEETKEDPKAEEKPAESAPADAGSDKKAEPTGKFAELIKQIEGLTALELAELVKALEERFGVSAAAPVAAIGGGPAAGGAEAAEEKTHWTVVLTSGGGNKIGAIKAVREVLPDLGLVEAKEMVEGAPKTIKENVSTEEANSIKEKLETAGAAVELK